MDISDPSGVIDTSPLNSESVDEAGACRATESASGIKGVSTDIHNGQQGKHEPGQNNYDDTRSPINEDVDPQELLDGAHSGKHPVVGLSGRGDPVVDFGVPIGVDVNTGQETQFGTIHSGKNGAHIVPATPRRKDND